MSNKIDTTTKKHLDERALLHHGWIRGKRKDGGIDWLYPGDMQPRTMSEAMEITRHAYPELYGEAT